MSSLLGLPNTITNHPLHDVPPSLAPLPKERLFTPRPGSSSHLVFSTEPDGLAAEQYRILRRRLTNAHPEGGAMLITSPSPGEGKTLTAANLAWCMAEAGHKTVLVDLDFRAPGLSETFGLAVNQDGVEDVLAGKRSVHEALRRVTDRPLYMLPVRRRRKSVGGLLSSAAVTRLLVELRANFPWILLDFAPAIPMADVGEVLPHVDGALLVVRAGRTDRAMIGPALDILGSTLWGVVVNDMAISGSAYYGNYGKQR